MSKKISELTPGSIVCFNTTLSGTDKSTDFIVLGQSEADDSILLLQKYVYEQRIFDSTNSSDYYTSSIDKYLSADITESDNYRSKFPEAIRNCLVKTTICSYSYRSVTTLNLTRDIFLMSCAEVGYSNPPPPDEGKSYLDILKTATGLNSDQARKAATESGDYCDWWLRSPNNASNNAFVTEYDTISGNGSAYGSFYVRPILSVVPATLVDDSTSTPTVIGPPYQSTIKESDSLIINTVENESVYNDMVAAGEIKENELYFVGGTITGGVSSVNNKTGAVTLTASDLGIDIATDSDVETMITNTINPK